MKLFVLDGLCLCLTLTSATKVVTLLPDVSIFVTAIVMLVILTGWAASAHQPVKPEHKPLLRISTARHPGFSDDMAYFCNDRGT